MKSIKPVLTSVQNKQDITLKDDNQLVTKLREEIIRLKNDKNVLIENIACLEADMIFLKDDFEKLKKEKKSIEDDKNYEIDDIFLSQETNNNQLDRESERMSQEELPLER